MRRPPYRTVAVALYAMTAALVGLALTGRFPAAAASYPAFVGCLGACVGFVAAKAYGEHKSNAEAACPLEHAAAQPALEPKP